MIRLFVCLFVCLATMQPSMAGTSPSKHDLKEMVGLSDLVFQGIITDVSYKNSIATPGQPSVPHTFVTYTITEVLQGEYPESSITLRFMGGIDESNPDLFSYSPEVPLFDVGEEDILFVSNNTEAECPLVHCQAGRIRVIDGKLYDDEGYRIASANAGQSLIKGELANLNQVKEHNLGDKKVFINNTNDAATVGTSIAMTNTILPASLPPPPENLLAEETIKAPQGKSLEKQELVKAIKKESTPKNKPKSVKTASLQKTFTLSAASFAATKNQGNTPVVQSGAMTNEEKAAWTALALEAKQQHAEHLNQSKNGQ